MGQKQFKSKERAAFEEWAATQNLDTDFFGDLGIYDDNATEAAWNAWFARAQLAAPVAQEPADQRVDDLAMLVRRLVRKLEKECPGTDLVPQALDYLHRKGLAGSPLREASQPAQGERTPKPFPHVCCKTPSECRRENACLDGWNCAAAIRA